MYARVECPVKSFTCCMVINTCR